MILCTKALAKKIDRAVFPGIQGGPLMHTIAAKAVALREAMQPDFQVYAQQVVDNACVFATALQEAGLRIVSGGTDTHLLMVDTRSAGLTGEQAEKALDRAGIATNKNMIPFDPAPPRVTSGVRLGTPAATTRGMGPNEMRQIAGWIARILRAPKADDVTDSVREEVRTLCTRFPIPILGER
jgi:glycine hydroxymethyltransferase